MNLSQSSLDLATSIGGNIWDACGIDSGAGNIDACVSSTYETAARRKFTPFLGQIDTANF